MVCIAICLCTVHQFTNIFDHPKYDTSSCGVEIPWNISFPVVLSFRFYLSWRQKGIGVKLWSLWSVIVYKGHFIDIICVVVSPFIDWTAALVGLEAIHTQTFPVTVRQSIDLLPQPTAWLQYCCVLVQGLCARCY